ncbi:hypothetical protein [Paeniglutamicibacter kerguelensis]|uniref:Uncharacterized protein n=2 Tax=Paeniglutamicibacter kerguelensis TaxID=254788 RepID=A0ABS4XF96_9MICC|nr:hypothetical protein [Paeniglutamicibacter kerguelensis]MBP2387141.1 hypothetical protein [Paeniglutamicibacter kerguelensis]
MGTQDGNAMTRVKGRVGPLTLRDTFVVVGAVLVLVGSLVPISWTKAISVNMWIFPGLPFHLLVTLLMPLAVGAAFAWRRFTKRTRVRVGSLSLDQFGSVVSLISAAYFFNSYVATMSAAFLLGFVGALAMICGTTLARYFGAFRTDFVPGDEAVISNDVRPVAASKAASAAAAATAASVDSSEGFGASSNPGASPSAPAVPKTAAAPEPEASVEAQPANSLATAGATAGVASAAAAATLAGTAAASEASSEAPEKAVGDEPAAAETEAEELEESSVEAPAAGDRMQESTGTGESEAGPEAVAPATAEAVNENVDAPAAASKVKVPETSDAGESDFPEVSLVQQDAEAESAPAATGLIPAAAPVQSREEAPQAGPVTSANPVAQAAPNATAALSRDELSAQMKAAAASQRAQEDEPFGARSDTAAEEPESSSFWFALNQPRPVYDPRSGARITTLQPGVWILCLEDRGQDYLVNLDGDRPAVLRELDNLQYPEK